MTKKQQMPVPPPELPARQHKRWGQKSRPLAADPLDKLIVEGPAPDLPPARPNPNKNTVNRGFTLTPDEVKVFDAAAKHVGISQYIRNLARADNPDEWPEDADRS
jgi:hypothetical protein